LERKLQPGKDNITSLVEVTPDWPATKAERAKLLCAEFIETPASKRFIFGRNLYTDAVISVLPVAGIVDDFTDQTEVDGTPIVRMKDLPTDAFVLAVSGGRPLTVRRLLAEQGIRQIDYFTFLKWSGLKLPEAVFNEGFNEKFEANRTDVEKLFDLLADDLSRETLIKLVGFRASYDIDWLEGFSERQTEQYFEDFLDVRRGEPVFLDVGGFDGFTAGEFIRRSPDFHSVYVFEPDPTNFDTCSKYLAEHRDVTILPYGASNENKTLRFSTNGSTSHFSDKGELELEVRRIDDIIQVAPTFIKMDIEGAELSALEGARETISKHRPALAICVYHRPSDLWEIPRLVQSISSGYKLYLRHYTECIYETVLYFIPNEAVKN
jgi:FkbM family methyltransferase